MTVPFHTSWSCTDTDVIERAGRCEVTRKRGYTGGDWASHARAAVQRDKNPEYAFRG